MTITFDSFLGRLPSCDGPARFALAASNGFGYQTTSLKQFIAPILKERSDVEASPDPAVIIISAAGAVGKSTLAKEVAFHRSAPLWDLASAKPVGNHSLLGQLTDSYSPQHLADAFAALASGTLFVVLDALDEARVQVTDAAFVAFLSDLAGLASSGTGCKAVMLGRTQIAETAWLILNELGVRLAFYTIEPFTPAQAEQYIELRVRDLVDRGSRLRDMRSQAFAEVRDLILAKLRDAIGATDGAAEEPEARLFLGYAPVLDAVAILLASEGNPAALRAELEATPADGARTSGSRSRALLSRIVQGIILREKEEKLVKNIRPVLGPIAKEPVPWETLYSGDEQCARLLGKMLSVTPKVELTLPPSLVSRYEEQIQIWLPEHPFLMDGRRPANAVFESYLLARGLFENSGGCRSSVERYLRRREYKPSRLLAEFYLLLMDQTGRDVIPAEHLGFVYDSLLAAETDTLHVTLTIDGSDPDDAPAYGTASEADGEFELLTLEPSGQVAKSSSLAFRTFLTATSSLTFGRYLRDTTLTVPCRVFLGEDASEFEIGPSVSVRCAELVIRAGSLVVGGKTRTRGGEEDDKSVRLDAERCETSVTKKPVAYVDLRVAWPDAREFPWTAFTAAETEDIPEIGPLHTVYRRFRRIVMTLRSHGKGSLARLQSKVEHQRVLQGSIGNRLLAQLLRDGVLDLRESFYHWMPDRAAEVVGVSWLDLRLGRSSPRLSQYLKIFIQGNGDLFA